MAVSLVPNPHFLTVPPFRRAEFPIHPNLKGLEQKLSNHHGLNLDFIIKEAKKYVDIGDYYVLQVPPLHPYLPGDNHQVFFLLSLLQEPLVPNFLSITSETGKLFLEEIAKQINPQLQPVIGINISSANVYWLRQGLFPQRRYITQSIGTLHAHALHLSDMQQKLTDIDYTDAGLYQKIEKEMGLSVKQIKEIGGIRRLVSLMGFDKDSVQHWQEIGIQEIVKNELPAQWNVRWKIPTANTTEYPFGLEITIPNANIKYALPSQGYYIWAITSAIEQRVLQGYGNVPYNFTVVFTNGQQDTKITFCPHDWVRAGIMEAMGIILHRT